MSVSFPEHPFWDFSLSVYSTEGVPAACLVLQDHHQVDVNVILFCCWLGASGRGALDAAEMAQVCESVEGWHEEIVRAVRAVRVRLKGGYPPAPQDLSDPLRSRLAKLEVELEHVEQLVLAASIEREVQENRADSDRLEDSVANVDAYFTAFGAAADRDDAHQMAVILAAAFPGLDGEEVGAACAAKLVH